VEAGKSGGTCPAALCAADEVAVELFLGHRIRFTDIAKIVQRTLEQHRNISRPSLEEILAADKWARECATRLHLGSSAKQERRDNPATKR
jgi:1-deoxy-D-xylulose-5-phosphate reductoisomerase